MHWLKLDVGLPQNGVWDDVLGTRLWLWLMCCAKKARRDGAMRFSYPVACRELSWLDPNSHQRVFPSHKAVRGALERLMGAGRVLAGRPCREPGANTAKGTDELCEALG